MYSVRTAVLLLLLNSEHGGELCVWVDGVNC